MTKEFCENSLSIPQIINMVISTDGSEQEGSRVKVELGNLKKFNYYGNYEQDLSSGIQDTLKSVKSPTFDSSTGGCDNFALEYHLKINFENVEGTDVTTPTFKIRGATVDIVYGKFVPDTQD